MIVPAWINPSFRLVEDGTTHDWAAINALAARLQPELPLGSRVAVTARSVATLLATLVAAQRAGVEVVLLRGAMSRFAGASVQIAKDGQLIRLGPGISLNNAQGFAVLIPTSGTTGEPKLVRQNFIRLIGRVRGVHHVDSRWLLTYEPTSFGGIQVIMAAVTAGATVIAAPNASSPQLARLALDHHATHVSATPGVWRTLLTELADAALPLEGVTLGGDIADQPLLDRLAARFPNARQRQIYASSEAGVVFTVNDGRAGFPAEWLESGIDDVELRVRRGILQVRCPRAMQSFAGGENPPFTTDHWLTTGDLVERIGDRMLFTGRIEAVITIDGVTVSPAKIEQALLEVPGVSDVQVTGGGGGHIPLTATVVAAAGVDTQALEATLQRHAEARLMAAERPQLIQFVDYVELALSGKKVRATAFQYVGASPLRPH
jgi:acyl-CoA synthetase (AMP-forming)/AMP-acid ligase II